MRNFHRLHQVEYDPALWNAGQNREIIHIDAILADIDKDYRPTVEITGDIAASVRELGKHLKLSPGATAQQLIRHVRQELEEIRSRWANHQGTPVHPLRLIHDLQSILTDDTTLLVDMGSVHLWHAHYLYSFQPRQMLITNGQQTLGVALPWAIAACLARPQHKVISVSGDGGFLFSAMELETAGRLQCNFVHLIWTSGTYDMIAQQELLKYGRTSGVNIGAIDVPGYAQAFGAKGFKITHPDEFLPTLRKAMEISGPVLIEIPVDYSDNRALYQNIHIDILH